MTTTLPITTSTTVDTYLAAIAAGDGVPADVFAPAVVLDATVPNWRFPLHGADAVARQFSGWFADPGTFAEIQRLPVDGGEVVRFLLTWLERGVAHAAHQCHVVQLDDGGLITSVQLFCGGRWDARLLQEMAAATSTD